MIALAFVAACGKPDPGSHEDAGGSHDAGREDAGPEETDAGDSGFGDAGFDGGWEDLEVSCDGYDNDGDGRVDVSRPVLLGDTANSYAFNWISRDGRLFATWTEGAVPHFGIYDGTLALLHSSPVPYSMNPQPFAAARAIHGGVGLAWVETDAGIDRLNFQVIESDGGYGWKQVVDRAENVIGSPFSAASAPGGACTVLTWNDSCVGWLRRGISVDANGALIAGPTNISPLLQGNQCGLETALFVVPFGDGVAKAAVGSLPDGGTGRTLYLTQYGCDLDAGARMEISAPAGYPMTVGAFGYGTVTSLQVDDQSAGELAITNWITQPDGTDRDALWHLMPDGGGAVEAWLDYDGTVERHIAYAVAGSGGPYLAGSSTTGATGAVRLFATRGTHFIDVTPSTVIPEPVVTTASLRNGLSAMGFIVDGGTGSDGGIRLLRYGQLFCEP